MPSQATEMSGSQVESLVRKLRFLQWLGLTFLRTSIISLYLLSGISALVVFTMLQEYTIYATEFSWGNTLGFILTAVSAYWTVYLAWTTAAKLHRAMKLPEEARIGVLVDRRQVPELFTLLDQLTAELHSLPLDTVYITGDVSASLHHYPVKDQRYLGERQLRIGLPLLDGLSPVQLKAIIAHELGHLAGGHGEGHQIAYAIERTWLQIAENLGKQKPPFGFAHVLRWYLRTVDAVTFPLGRAREFQADRAAAEIAGAEIVADALVVTFSRIAYAVDRFAAAQIQMSTQHPAPPISPFSWFGQYLIAADAEDEAREYLGRELKLVTALHDHHPCLRDRLKNLGQWPASDSSNDVALPPLSVETAAPLFLGAGEASLRAELDQRWIQIESSWWGARYAECKTLRDLEQLAQEQQLTPEMAWERARLSAKLQEPAVALKKIEEIIATQFWRVPPREIAVRLLMELDDSRGIDLCETLLPKHPQQYLHSIRYFLNYYERHGETKLLESKAKFVRAFEKRVNAVKAERRKISDPSRFMPANPTPEMLAECQAQIDLRSMIEGAFLVQAKVRRMPEVPCYVLVLCYPDPRMLAPEHREIYVAQSQSSTNEITTMLNRHWWFEVILLQHQSDANLRYLQRLRSVPGVVFIEPHFPEGHPRHQAGW